MDSQYPLLIVDDEPSVLSALKRELKTLAPVTTCTSAKDALKTLKTRTFAVVISDYKMPNENGIDFLASLKELPYEPVKILMTAFSELDIAIDAVNRAGIYYFLRKPWNSVELKTLVSRSFEAFKERNELKHSRQKLLDIDSIKQGITGLLSHELNTPLTTLKGYISLLDDKTADKELSGIVKGLRQGIERLEGFITETVETANLELGKAPHKKENVKIGELISRYLDFIQVDSALQFDSSASLIEKAFARLSLYLKGKGAVTGFCELEQEYLFLVINIKNGKLDAVKSTSFLEPTGDVMNHSGSSLDLIYVASLLKACGVTFNILNVSEGLRLELTFSGVKH